MPGNPRNYPGWEKYAQRDAARKAYWAEVKRYKQETGRLPWQVKCRFCESVATGCLASDLTKPDTLRVPFCPECSGKARAAMKIELTRDGNPQ